MTAGHADRRRRSRPDDGATVRIGRERLRVIDTRVIRRHRYLLVKKLSRSPRTRYLAVDADAAFEPCVVMSLPDSEADRAHIRVLKRLPRGNVNLPRIIAYQRSLDELAVVLAWVNGISLEQYLAKVRSGKVERPSAFHCVRLVRGLAHGLRTLHTHAQLVHADLTPANLILTSHNSYLTPVDFGSAWLVERAGSRLPADGMTRVYAAPELHNGAPANFRCDHFSASVILYQLLTLTIPYTNLGGKAGRVGMAERMQGKLIAPSQRSPDRRRMPRAIWQGIDRVVTTGLALNPDHRFATPGAWLDALDAVYLEMQYQARRRDAVPARSMTRVIDWLALRFGGK